LASPVSPPPTPIPPIFRRTKQNYGSFLQTLQYRTISIAEDKDGVTTSGGPILKTGFTKTGH